MKSCKKCSKPFTKMVGSFNHVIFGKTVLVKDVPYGSCENCGEVEYLAARKVEFLIRDAYRANQDIVTYV